MGSRTVGEATAATKVRDGVRVISLYGRDFRRLVGDVEKADQARTPQRYARLHSGRLTPPTAPEMHEDFLHFAIRGNRRTSRVGRA